MSKTLFDLAKVGGIEIAASAVERINSEKVLASRWSGENFSSRIWTDKRKLSNIIKTTIVSGIHQGLDVREMSKRINDVMSGGYKNAVRLVRTEMNFVNNQAAYDSFDECGILYYEFIAVLDNRTSKMCQSRDGEVYPMSEKSVGFNYPPLHPRCRSTVAPYVEGSGRLGSRIARVNGKRLHVPEDMTYSEFKAKYLTPSKSEGRIDLEFETSASKVNNNNRNLSLEIKLVNPNYKVGEDKWRFNCAKCAVTYEARCRGLDVEAMPRVGINDPMNKAKNWLSSFEYSKEDIRKCTGATLDEVTESARKIIREYGEDARVLVFYQCQNGYFIKGHVLNARCLGGIVDFFDTQSGEMSAEYKLKEAQLDKVYILRVDNLKMTDQAKRCYIKRG